MVGILIAVIVGAALMLGLMALRTRVSSKDTDEKSPNKKVKRHNSAGKIRDCTKKLSHNPHNVGALTTLSDIYFEDGAFDKAMPLYDTLFSINAAHPEIDVFKTSLRLGICAMKTGNNDVAMKGLIAAYKKNPIDYDTNYYFGTLLYQTGEYQKAIACLKKVLVIKPETMGINKPMGLSLYKMQRYKESLPYLRRAVDEAGNDKEVLYSMANAMEESGIGEKALKVFMHLRTDKQYGAQSCLLAGMIHERLRQQSLAIADYEIGTKLEDVDPKTLTNIYYRAGSCHIALNNIPQALEMLKHAQSITPNYKDTGALIQRYQELNSNSNLQVYLMGPSAAFVALCRKAVPMFYPRSIVHFSDINVSNDGVEILCTVQSGAWEDTEIFRFYRSTSPVGEIPVRDLHAKIQESQIDKGVCVTAGTFTDGAKRYVDGRPIDLHEKEKLMAILKKVK